MNGRLRPVCVGGRARAGTTALWLLVGGACMLVAAPACDRERNLDSIDGAAGVGGHAGASGMGGGVGGAPDEHRDAGIEADAVASDVVGDPGRDVDGAEVGEAGSADGSGPPDSAGDAGEEVTLPGLTACRDLSPRAGSLAAAAASPSFLLAGALGASIVRTDDWAVPRTFTGQYGAITGGAVAPDASWGATVGSDGALRIWRAADGHELARPALAAPPVLVAASPLGGALAVTDSAGGLAVLRAPGGEPIWSEAPSSLPTVSSLLFAPDGLTLLLGSTGTIERRDAALGAPRAPFTVVGAVDLMAISQDGAVLAIAARMGTSVRILGAADGALRRTISLTSGVDNAMALALSAHGDQVFVGTTTDGLRVHDTQTGALVRTLLGREYVSALALSSDGATLAVSHTTALDFFRVSDGVVLNTFGSVGFVWGGAFDGRGRLAFAPVASPNEIWDPVAGRRLRSIPRQGLNQGAVVFAPSGHLLVNFDSSASFWDVDLATMTAGFAYEIVDSNPYLGSPSVFTPDGKALVGLRANGEIEFWDASNGKLLRGFAGPPANVSQLVISSSGSLLATVAVDPTDAFGPTQSTIQIWDASSGALLQSLHHGDLVAQIAFSPDGTLLLAGDSSGVVRLWSVLDGTVVRDLASGFVPHPGYPGDSHGFSVAFSPDGKLAASSGVDWTVTEGHTGDIAIWSVPDGRQVGRLLSLAEANLGRLNWSPDGRLIAAGFGGGTRIWCLDELPPFP